MTDQMEYFKCPKCLGLGIKGKWEIYSVSYIWGFKRMELHCVYSECVRCGGRGYLDWLENIIVPNHYITRVKMVKTSVIIDRFYPLVSWIRFWIFEVPYSFFRDILLFDVSSNLKRRKKNEKNNKTKRYESNISR